MTAVEAAQVSLADLYLQAEQATGGLFAMLDWAEDEIARARRMWPDKADELWHSFKLIRPVNDEAMRTEFVFRGHARELLARVAAGEDTRPATAAEVCIGLREVSLVAPMHGAGAGLYFRMWLTAFPDNPVYPEQHAQQVHYERLHRSHMDDLEREMRRRLAQPGRRLVDIECRGEHHGEQVKCRFAERPAIPAPRRPEPLEAEFTEQLALWS